MADVDAFIDQWGAVDSPFCPPVLTSVANGCKRPRRLLEVPHRVMLPLHCPGQVRACLRGTAEEGELLGSF